MKGKTILICDDDESVIEILTLVLRSQGFAVISEVNSLNIFAIIKDGQPDLLLVDFWMPALNGDEVIRNLKNDPSTKNLPVILISASVDAELVAAQTGADAFIAKPFQLEELLAVIQSKLSLN